MKYKFLALSVALVAVLAMVRCGGSGGGGKDPNSAKATFENPDGTLTDENAAETMDEALKASNALEGLNFGSAFKLSPHANKALSRVPAGKKISERLQTVGEGCSACITQSGDNSAVTDWECLFSSSCISIDGCTGHGTSTTTGSSSDAGTEYTINYDAAGLTCTDTSEFGEFGFNFDGTESGVYLEDGSTIFCMDATVTFSGPEASGDEYVVDQCYYNGGILVGEDGEQIVCTAISANADCSELCADFEDADGIAKVTCPITASDESCPADLTGIQSFDNTACVVTRDATCSDSSEI